MIKKLYIITTGNGSWSDWKTDGSCSVTCGIGSTLAVRYCNNPTPAYGGKECEGSNQTSIICSRKRCTGKYLDSFIVISI